MRATWRLATSQLFARPGRTTLLVIAVALATALSVGAAGAVDAIEASLRHYIAESVGAVDGRIRQKYGARFDASVREIVADWPGVEHAAAMTQTSVTAYLKDRSGSAMAQGIDPERWYALHPPTLSAGERLSGPDQAVIGQRVARRLKAEVGDTIALKGQSGNIALTVVGIIDRPALEVLQNPAIFVTHEVAQALAGVTGERDRVEIALADGMNIDDLAARAEADLPPGVELQLGASASTGVDQTLKGLRLFHVIITGICFLATAFVILTGLTTALAETRRQIGVLRSIGATGTQVTLGQLLGGGLISLIGAVLGVAIGLALLYLFYRRFDHLLAAGFIVRPTSVAVAVGAALAAGLVGAAWPAWLARRVNPLEAIRVQARPPRTSSVVLATLLALVAVGLAVSGWPRV
ncbi:MAG: ABC transporter permease, partial [Phycisphaeraceae bacterium]|nr:ABC transporter permease [Phycisphaeraceae bacterium]